VFPLAFPQSVVILIWPPGPLSRPSGGSLLGLAVTTVLALPLSAFLGCEAGGGVLAFTLNARPTGHKPIRDVTPIARLPREVSLQALREGLLAGDYLGQGTSSVDDDEGEVEDVP
jgi:hypothetical protein